MPKNRASPIANNPISIQLISLLLIYQSFYRLLSVNGKTSQKQNSGYEKRKQQADLQRFISKHQSDDPRPRREKEDLIEFQFLHFHLDHPACLFADVDITIFTR